MDPMRIAFIGFGEVGSILARDLRDRCARLDA
jgi:3-hydroxyisobutyrate dehydrogenase-like beta-hydroxyacid dehydrogenase